MPPVELVTLTVIVQLLMAASVPPARLMLLLPATAVRVPVQVPPRPFGEATTMFVSASLKATLVSGVADRLFTVNVIVDVPPDTMVVGANALVMDGLPTDRMAEEASGLLPPLVDVTTDVVLV